MNSISNRGNVTAQIQAITNDNTFNKIGERVHGWNTIHDAVGFLDLMNGDSHFTNYDAKIQESTHIFLCDYFPLDKKANEVRMIINGEIYDVRLIDNPMGLNEHYEFYLKFVG